MQEQMEIRTLGGLTVRCGDEPIEFETQKEAALLVYLACTGRTLPREVLAEMLWEERTQSRALGNLRHVLAQLRRRIKPYVMITRETVAMNPASDWWLDTTAFETCLNSNGGGQLDQLEEAVDLYRGDFLAGVYVDSRAFEDWALLERERLRFCVMETLDRLVHHHATRSNYRSGIARAIQQLQIDPLREETHHHLMRLLALSGQRAKALEQYETCRRVLDEELGVEPMPETINLYERIRAGEVDQPPPTPVSDAPVEQVNVSAPAVTPHNLTSQATSFVGREVEIAEVLDQLADPECRLITLLGPGGIGKTRLGLAIAERALAAFAGGVYFVELAALNEPDVLTASIAASVGCQFHPRQGSQEQQLLRFLGEKTILLVMDNFEHLLEGVGVLVTLLEGAPNIKLLVTSREALNLGWEWPYDLRGLAAPIGSHDPDAMRYDAVQLFIARARRAQPGFSLAEHRTDVIRACQLVEGMPLAIELAAAWLRLMPLPDILGELVDLETPQRDVPDRHRSLRALFDHTWEHLSPREQDVLMKLAVFRGGFTREAAEDVTGATMPILATLVHKSLLRVDHHTGRFTRHPLLYEYSAALLAKSGEKETISRRHAEYFVSLVERADIEHQGPDVGYWASRVYDDFDNVRAVLSFTLAGADVPLGLRMVGAMRGIWYTSAEGTVEEGLRWTKQALEHVEDVAPAIKVKALTALGWLYSMEDAYEEGAQAHSEALKLYRELDDQTKIARTLVSLGYCTVFGAKQHGHGLTLYKEAYNIYRDLGDKAGMGRSLNMIGELARLDGRLADAAKAYEEALAIAREVGFISLESVLSSNLGHVAHYQGDYARAEALFKRALTLHWQLEATPYAAGGLGMLVGPTTALGFPQRAARLLGASEAIVEDMGHTIEITDRAEYDHYVTQLREALDPDTFDALYAEGRAMSLDKAVAYALEDGAYALED